MQNCNRIYIKEAYIHMVKTDLNFIYTSNFIIIPTPLSERGLYTVLAQIAKLTVRLEIQIEY